MKRLWRWLVTDCPHAWVVLGLCVIPPSAAESMGLSAGAQAADRELSTTEPDGSTHA